jgi:hypothetical protein
MTLAACHKDSGTTYVINFTWVKPKAADEAWALNQAQKVEVKLKRDDNSTVHNAKLVVNDSKDVLVKELFSQHVSKSGEYTISEDFTPTKVGTYKLVVSSTDGNGANENKNTTTIVVK